MSERIIKARNWKDIDRNLIGSWRPRLDDSYFTVMSGNTVSVEEGLDEGIHRQAIIFQYDMETGLVARAYTADGYISFPPYITHPKVDRGGVARDVSRDILLYSYNDLPEHRDLLSDISVQATESTIVTHAANRLWVSQGVSQVRRQIVIYPPLLDVDRFIPRESGVTLSESMFEQAKDGSDYIETRRSYFKVEGGWGVYYARTGDGVMELWQVDDGYSLQDVEEINEKPIPESLGEAVIIKPEELPSLG